MSQWDESWAVGDHDEWVDYSQDQQGSQYLALQNERV